MATTFVCIRERLPADLGTIVMDYFRTNTANLGTMAAEGRYEECLGTVTQSPNNVLFGACRGGHIAIVALAIARGANKWNIGLTLAITGGHLDVVRLMLDKGATVERDTFGLACMGTQ